MRNAHRVPKTSAELTGAAAEELRESVHRLGYPRDRADALSEILKRVPMKRLHGGEAAIREGEFAAEVYIVRRGRLRISVRHGHEERMLAVLSAGAIIGEIGVLRGVRRTATVTAIEPCELFVIDREAFGRLLGSSDDFRRRVESLVAERGGPAMAPGR